MSEVDNRTRNRALAGLVAAIVLTVGAWFFINGATNRGLARLDRMDAIWAVCKLAYDSARTGGDTSRIDLRQLSAAIDSGKADAPRRCGDLRRPDEAQQAKDSVRRVDAAREFLPPRNKKR